jgi:hypothetical protein
MEFVLILVAVVTDNQRKLERHKYGTAFVRRYMMWQLPVESALTMEVRYEIDTGLGL